MMIPLSGRFRVDSGTPWEPVFGYSRAIRVGNAVHVSGTTATDAEGRIVGAGDMYAQTVQTLDNIRRALERAGAGMEDVVRTRVYVTDISRYAEVARAHGEVFGTIRPASALIGVAALVDPAMLVEIEAEALIQDAG